MKIEPETITEEELKATLPKIFEKAQIDNEFRELCLNDPGKAVMDITGKVLPAGAKLNFESAE